MNLLTRFINDLALYGLEKFGKYYASYPGSVFRRDDPMNLGRLQIYCPQVYGVQAYKEWVPQKGCYSGKDYGMQCIPQIGEMIWIEFLFGNPRRPVWTYGNPGMTKDGKNEKPEDLRDPDLYWFKTPGGLGIVFDDKAGSIDFIHPNGNRVTVDENGVSGDSNEHTINVNGVKISITDAGINIDGNGKKVYINGSHPVLYSKVDGASVITDLNEIGISKKVVVG